MTFLFSLPPPQVILSSIHNLLELNMKLLFSKNDYGTHHMKKKM
jgi:hypothetical protein